jgi:hypothetical protein
MYRNLAFAAALGVVILAGTAWAVARSQGQQGGWINYAHEPLRNSHVYVKQDKRRPDGSCIQVVKESEPPLQPGSPGVAEQEIAFNPSTCQERWERGEPNPNAHDAQTTATDGASRTLKQTATAN